MKTYEIMIKPTSGFGTPIKGDTLFGHICWQAVYDDALFGKSIKDLLADYSNNPFLIVSSAFLKIAEYYAFKRPDLPIDMLFNTTHSNLAEVISKRKEFKSKCWMLVKDSEKLKNIKADNLYFNNAEIFNKFIQIKAIETGRQFRKRGIKSIIADFTQPHNTINRLTGTTGEGQFAPYSVDQKVFINETELVIFTSIREDISIAKVLEALKRIGATGFGKDASTGLGRFEIVSSKELDLNSIGMDKPNACYTLAPCVPEKDAYSKMFFTPFTRFGRHGDVLGKSGKPFKNPVIMADEGAVFVINESRSDIFQKPYIGTAVTDLSKAKQNTVTQGYSLYIPVMVEV